MGLHPGCLWRQHGQGIALHLQPAECLLALCRLPHHEERHPLTVQYGHDHLLVIQPGGQHLFACIRQARRAIQPPRAPSAGSGRRPSWCMPVFSITRPEARLPGMWRAVRAGRCHCSKANALTRLAARVASPLFCQGTPTHHASSPCQCRERVPTRGAGSSSRPWGRVRAQVHPSPRAALRPLRASQSRAASGE